MNDPYNISQGDLMESIKIYSFWIFCRHNIHKSFHTQLSKFTTFGQAVLISLVIQHFEVYLFLLKLLSNYYAMTQTIDYNELKNLIRRHRPRRSRLQPPQIKNSIYNTLQNIREKNQLILSINFLFGFIYAQYFDTWHTLDHIFTPSNVKIFLI